MHENPLGFLSLVGICKVKRRVLTWVRDDQCISEVVGKKGGHKMRNLDEKGSHLLTIT